MFYYKSNNKWVKNTKKQLQIVSPSTLKRKRAAFERKKLNSAFKRWRAYQYRKQKGLCFYCRQKIIGAWVTDHYIPLYRGGTSAYKNLRVCCWDCNKQKSVQMPTKLLLKQLLNNRKGQIVSSTSVL